MMRLWRRIGVGVVLAAAIVPLLGVAKGAKRPLAPVDDFDPHVAGQVVILAAGKDFVALEREAKKLARTIKVPFSLRGMVYDKKNGLHYEDGPGEGGYLFRRDSTMEIGGKERHFISIEESAGYPGLKGGYYLIVADICFEPKEAARVVKRYRQVAPGAYAPRTAIYMGCME